MHVDEEYAMIGLLSLFAEQVSCPVEGLGSFVVLDRFATVVVHVPFMSKHYHHHIY